MSRSVPVAFACKCKFLHTRCSEEDQKGTLEAVGALLQPCPTQVGGLTFSGQQQRGCCPACNPGFVLLLFPNKLLLFLPLSLTPSDCLSATLSSLCLPLTSSLCLSSVPHFPLSSSYFSPTGKSPERGSSLDALPSRWIMTQQSYFIRPLLFLPCSSTDVAADTSTRFTGANGNSRPGWPCSPPSIVEGVGGPKVESRFTRS